MLLIVEKREQSMHETLFKLFSKLNKPTNGIGMTEIITFFLPLIMVSTSTQNLSIFSTLISRCLACNHACNSWAFIILFLLRLLSIVIRSCPRGGTLKNQPPGQSQKIFRSPSNAFCRFKLRPPSAPVIRTYFLLNVEITPLQQHKT